MNILQVSRTFTVNLLRDGVDGVDSVFVDFDNENDSFLYDGQGVNHSEPVTSNGVLYKGDTAVTEGVTWGISDYVGVYAIQNATTNEYPQSTYPTHAWITPGGVLTVNGLSASSGYVMVRVVYNNKEYYCKITLRRIVEADKYEIITDPSAIAYNITRNQPATSTVSVSIYRTVMGGARTKIDSLPVGYTLAAYDSLGNAVTILHDAGSTVWSFVTSNADSSSYRVVLTNGSGSELDAETIPIAKATDGQNGTPGANGQDSVVYEIITDTDSFDAYTSQFTVSIRKTVGGTSSTFYINPDTAYVTDGLTLSFAGAMASKAQLRMGAPSLVYLSNRPHANASSLILRLTKGGVQVAEKEIRTSYLTQYLMTATPSQVNIDNGGKFMSTVDSKIKVKVQKILGSGEPVPVTSADGLEVYINAKYSDVQDYPDSRGEIELQLVYPQDTAKNPDGTRLPITVELINDDETIDRLTIPIVSQGENGAQGLQGCSTRVGEFKENTEYVNQDGINMEGGSLSIGYIDVVAVERPKTDPDYDISDGYYWYMCMVESTADYGYLAPANGEDTWYHRGQSDQKLVWKAIGVQGPSFFSLLIAKNAWIKFGSGNQFVIQDSEDNIVAGLTGYIPDADNEDRSVRIWAGGEDPALSPFRVLQSGDFYAEKAHIRGLVEVRDANEGLIVYDNVGNARVQVVANEVDEPVNENINRTGTRQSSYQIAADESFNLTPTPISLSLGELKTGAMLTVNGLSFTVSTNSGSTHIKLTKRNGIAEKMTVILVLMDTNGNMESTLTSTYEATADTLIDDISFAFQGILINTTKSYVMGVSAMIENINTYNSDADTWGGLARNVTVTTVAEIIAKHATPIGTRIGTNGIFVNLDTGKSVSINSSMTEIKYGSSRLRVSDSGVYLYDGASYVPIEKKCKTISANYVVSKEDGLLILNNTSDITLTYPIPSAREVKIISLTGQKYTIAGTVIRHDGNTPSTFSVSDKVPRLYVQDDLGNVYEYYGSN